VRVTKVAFEWLPNPDGGGPNRIVHEADGFGARFGGKTCRQLQADLGVS
jgi:hypothetical protein